ncbi:MAG: ATP-binding cassette domain-containing protein [Lachnospiraceae bacterium]
MSIEARLKRDFGQFKLDMTFSSLSDRIGILGASGCGKSMTLKSIAGITELEEGYLAINGKVLFDSAHRINITPQKRQIGYLFQNYALFPTQSVEKNIMAGLHGSKRENRERAQEMIEKFHLKGFEKRLPGELSGGQQQRVALARIMAYDPLAILLDEPFSALDIFLKDRLQQEMQEMLADYQGTVILVSHSHDEIYRFSKELLIMHQGQSICQGQTQSIFINPKRREAAQLTGCKNIAEIQNIEEHTFRVPDWNISITMEQKLPSSVHAIGYRAHDFIPIWGARREHCIPMVLHSVAELPFEKQFFLKGARECEICWFAQSNQCKELEVKGQPDYLQIDPDKILFLS